jgi:hypothetical protein
LPFPQPVGDRQIEREDTAKMTDYKRCTVAAVIVAGMLVSPAHAGKPCDPGSGTACPEFTAPATTAVPGVPLIDTHVTIPGNDTPIVLFNGVIPPNGYWIQVSNAPGTCYVNDDNTVPNFGEGYALNATGEALQTPVGYHPVRNDYL